MKKLLTLVMVLIDLLAGPALVNAQERYPKGPEIHPDHTVTFTLKAPDAKTVTLNGAWPGGTARTTVPMVRDDKGVWSVTVGPIKPDLWTYSFKVDGVSLPDPQNLHFFPENNQSALLIAWPESYD